MKKILSAFMVLCMAVMCFTPAVFAEENDTVNGIRYDKEHITVSDISYSNNQSWDFFKAGTNTRAEYLGLGDCIRSPWDSGYAKNSPYTLTVTFASDIDFTVELDFAFSAHWSSGYVAVDGTKYIELENNGTSIDQNNCLKDHLNQKLSAGTHKVEIYFDKSQSGDNGNFMAYVYNFCACTADHSDISGVVVPADCFRGGYTDFTCSSCGFSWRADETARLEHEFSDGKCIHCGQYQMEQTDDGTYLIKYADQLNHFARIVNETNSKASAKLVNDIVFNENVLNEDGELNTDAASSFSQFTPIGTESQPFEGTFDGDGHSISGLYVYPEEAIKQSTAAAKNLALVGVSSGAAVKNVTLKDAYINGLESVAGICAFAQNSSIDNCRVLSSRIESHSLAAGICARIETTSGSKRASVKNCVNSAAVVVLNERAAGIAAYPYYRNVSIENCLNLGTITGSTIIGGIAGYIEAYLIKITGCLDLGTLSAAESAGHIVGKNYMSSFEAERCGYKSDMYPAIGSSQGNGYRNDSKNFSEQMLSSGEAAYYLNGNQSTAVAWYQTLGEDAYPTPDSSRKIVYAAGDYFTNINCSHENTEPCHVDPTCTDEGFDGTKCSDCGVILKKISTVPPTGEHSYKDYVCSVCGDGKTPDGSGTEDDPLIIENPGNLLWLSQYYNDKLREDASIPENVNVFCDNYINMDLLPEGTVFDPIGSDIKPFKGVFDGGFQEERIIENLKIDSYDNTGLFGYAENACIKNVCLSNARIYGRNNVGGIVGTLYEKYSETVSLSRNSIAKSVIRGVNNVGGIAGLLGGGTASENNIAESELSVSSTGRGYAGGIAAVNSGIIKDSAVSMVTFGGTDDCEEYFGGITAHNKNSVKNCMSYYCTYENFSYSGGVVCVGLSPRNSYYIAASKINSMADGTPATAEQFSSGEICYLLNGGVTDGTQAWYQNLEENQSAPVVVFDANHIVYKNKDGYSNSPEIVFSLTLSGDELKLCNPFKADEDTKSVSLYFAAYKDSKLISIRRITYTEDSTIKIPELGLDIENADSVRIFAWGSALNPAEGTIIYK